MNKLLQEAMAMEFSQGCGEKCKIFLEKSVVAMLLKSSQLADFLKRLDADDREEVGVLPLPPIDTDELLFRLRAAGLRKIDLSAWMRSMELQFNFFPLSVVDVEILFTVFR